MKREEEKVKKETPKKVRYSVWEGVFHGKRNRIRGRHRERGEIASKVRRPWSGQRNHRAHR